MRAKETSMKNKTWILVGIAVLCALYVGLKYLGSRQTDLAPLTTSIDEVTPQGTDSSGGTSATAPRITLTITSPKNGATVTTSAISVRGKTVPNAEVFVNELETRADGSGNFSVSMSLDEGENYMIVIVNDANGNMAETELTVTYNDGQ